MSTFANELMFILLYSSPEQLRTTATVWEEADCFSLLPKGENYLG